MRLKELHKQLEDFKSSDHYKKVEEMWLLAQEEIDAIKFDIKQEEKKIIEQMEMYNMKENSQYKIKYAYKKRVNVDRLLSKLDGDIDVFCSLASISQKTLHDYVKENPEYKDLKRTIEVVEQKPYGIIIK